MEVSDRKQTEFQAIGQDVTGPRAKDRGTHDERQPPTGAAPNQNEQGGVKDPDEDRQDERGIDVQPLDPTSSTADGASDTGRAMRPPPMTTSPSYRTAA